MTRGIRFRETFSPMNGRFFVQAFIGGNDRCDHLWREKIKVIRAHAEPLSESGWRCLLCGRVEAWANVP